MDKEELCDDLTSLVKLDIDAYHAYTQAIEQIDLHEVKAQLTTFRAQHEQHVLDLSPVIVSLGGKAPEFSPDFKGYLIQGMTALRGVTGTEGALKAMKTNEELTNRTYEKALAWEQPPEVRRIVQKNRDDEARHLAYVEGCLARKVWQHAA